MSVAEDIVLESKQQKKSEAHLLDTVNDYYVLCVPYRSRTSTPTTVITRSSAIAEGPRDALGQLKAYQLLQHCTKNRI